MTFGNQLLQRRLDAFVWRTLPVIRFEVYAEVFLRDIGALASGARNRLPLNSHGRNRITLVMCPNALVERPVPARRELIVACG